ncbi:MAG: protein kinase, partial [Candidatus Sumerlaeia bacterium]|nr:protein kinase [Candidatus Sumerlaeia bacterium]
MSESPNSTKIRALLITDLVKSVQMIERLGDGPSSVFGEAHERMARKLLLEYDGLEIDKTDGFLLLFKHPLTAVRCALDYHLKLKELSASFDLKIEARAGIHFGDVVLRKNPPEVVARGAKPLEVDGLSKPMASRVMDLAQGGQTLMTRGAFDLARRAVVGNDSVPGNISWLAHGHYQFKGVEEPIEVFEAGLEGFAPLVPPPDTEKATRFLRPGEEETGAWRPASGNTIPGRENWVLRDKLGEGGFGEVWHVHHHKTREERVYKFCFDPDRIRGLKREATIFRLLKETLGDRPDIARVIDWNFDSPPFFIEGDYTEAGNLIKWAEEQGGIASLPLESRLQLIAEVATALAAAHSVGVLHKDIKPSNILVYSDVAGAPHARLTDFGIGMITDRERLALAGVTATGITETHLDGNDSSRTGTRLYAAPEMLEGKPATIQADVYALGVMLYQIVVGDLHRALTSDWRDDVSDELLLEDIAACVAGDPDRRLANVAEISTRLLELETRR